MASCLWIPVLRNLSLSPKPPLALLSFSLAFIVCQVPSKQQNKSELAWLLLLFLVQHLPQILKKMVGLQEFVDKALCPRVQAIPIG
jgi:dipeptide/tripeptide permease